MCPTGYHHNGFVATHSLGHMMYGCTVVRLYIYIYIYILYFKEIKQNFLFSYNTFIHQSPSG